MNYPAVRLNIDRVHAAELGLTQKEIVDNVITALNSNTMIAPNYWVDHQTGNDYFLTVQYYETATPAIHNFVDLTADSAATRRRRARSTASPGCARIIDSSRSPMRTTVTTLGNVASVDFMQSPTEIDHYQIQRVADVYVDSFRRRSGQGLGADQANCWPSRNSRRHPHQSARHGAGNERVVYTASPSVCRCPWCFCSLILVAQFRSFKDPFLIMLAIPMGFIGVLVMLPLTHTTLNVMSLMGVLMLVGIAASNSILIVEFAHRLEEQGQIRGGCGDHVLPGPPAADPDDLARHHHRHGADGAEAGHRQRTVCAAGPGHHRRPDVFGSVDGLHRSGRLSSGVPQEACSSQH